MKVVIALGSNLGDRTSYIDQAVAQLSQVITVLKVSSKIETEPVSEIAQPNYLNAVLIGDTQLDAENLLKKMQEIETNLGRVRDGTKWAARTIDLDLIIFGDNQIDTNQLKVPHPLAFQRDFVLKPWLEIDPDGEIPGKGAIKLLI